MTFRKRLYITLQPGEKGGILESIFEIVLISIIILNILAIVLDSVPKYEAEYHTLFANFEVFSIVFFTLEYIARLYSIVENKAYAHPISGRIKYAITPIAIIDLLAFIPFYFTFLPVDLRFIRIIRLTALFRMFKITRYLHALKIFKKVLVDRKEHLVLSFTFILLILIIISFVMYYVERDVQPEAFSSIPASMWWGISTLTTVGYGDIVPVTPLGKFLAGLFSLSSVGMLALPAGILSSGFYEVLHTNVLKKEIKKCPHCGEDLHD